jgi:hypothetical protein
MTTTSPRIINPHQISYKVTSEVVRRVFVSMSRYRESRGDEEEEHDEGCGSFTNAEHYEAPLVLGMCLRNDAILGAVHVQSPRKNWERVLGQCSLTPKQLN